MRVLLIGGNGFIGSHLIDRLLVNGHTVRVFDRSHEKYRKPNVKVEYILGDITDVGKLVESMIDIDVVFHLASSSVPSSSILNPKYDIEKNLCVATIILDSIVKHEIKRLVYFSSGGAVYGNLNKLPIKESESLFPISSYGLSKLMVEKLIHLYKYSHSFKSIIIRPSNPYGPRQGHHKAQGVISTFLRKSKAGETFEIFGDGENIKDYIFVDDLVTCVISLLENDCEGTFNLGTGKGNSINQIVDEINKVTSRINNVEYTEEKNYDIKNFVLDNSKLKKAIGEVDFLKLNDGVRKTWDWISKKS